MKKHFGLALGCCLCLTLLSVSSVSSAATQIVGSKCVKAGSFRTAKNVKYQCKKSAKGLRWVTISAKSKSTTTTSITTTTTTSTTVALPLTSTSCSKPGAKVFGNGGYMKCVWSGGPTIDFLKNLQWRYYSISQISSSKSNNYTITPRENALCTKSGDTFDVSGGILECRWVNGGKLQWIRINTIKSTFQNPQSPVSIEV